MRQCRGERQMRKCEIAVGLDGAAKPGGRLFVSGEMQLRGAGAAHPVMGGNIAGAEAQRLAIVALGLLGPPEGGLRHTCQRMGAAELKSFGPQLHTRMTGYGASPPLARVRAKV